LKLDILIFAAHPDDAELGCGGTIAKHVSLGYQLGIVDLTEGELGTRGNAETRKNEAADASKILGISYRDNLKLPDGHFLNSKENRMAVIQKVRMLQPDIVLANALFDRHPDHGMGANLVYDGCFLSGLEKIVSMEGGKKQKPWRPKAIYHYIQSQFMKPDFVIDVTEMWSKKMQSIRAYKSQFYDPKSAEPETYISSPDFLNMLEARGIELGHSIGVKYGEGFVARRRIGVNSLLDIF